MKRNADRRDVIEQKVRNKSTTRNNISVDKARFSQNQSEDLGRGWEILWTL
jgi:hypothetical protein